MRPLPNKVKKSKIINDRRKVADLSESMDMVINIFPKTKMKINKQINNAIVSKKLNGCGMIKEYRLNENIAMENASTNDTTNILDTKDCLDQGEIDKYVSTFLCIRKSNRSRKIEGIIHNKDTKKIILGYIQTSKLISYILLIKIFLKAKFVKINIIIGRMHDNTKVDVK